ncbi:MAG: hypothetical protein PCFJNLEI_00961 [Verrucomicrobiae bacterium]|nr:hypothetical protein [Verrucomicrobiae bacterium]
MQKLVLVTVAAVLATGSTLFAEDAKEAQFEKMGALRARVLAKIPTLWPIVDYTTSGVIATNNAVLQQYQTSNTSLQKKYQAEAAKTGEARDQATVDALGAKIGQLTTLWADQTKAAQEFNTKMGALNAAYQALQQLSMLCNNDQNWLRANLDPALYITVLTAMDKSTDDIKAQATPLLADYLKGCGERERALKE